ncbi:MAG: hypothetical protein B7733_26530 [Myxococcales bacterium FL481]|nr:MAG: hypothetical protein B7733_26530 [Myxococcales bacterium FL481]
MNARDERLMAYHDGELSEPDRVAFEREMAGDPQLREQLSALETTRALVVGEALREADDVPQARFEQIWDQVDRELDAPAEAVAPVAPANRWWRWLPLAAAAAAAGAVLVIWPRGQEPTSASELPPAIASTPSTPSEPAVAQAPPPPAAPTADEPADHRGVDIERIEFAGRSGRIDHIDDARGTTTVIWIEEDPQPVTSERSL